MSDTARRRAVSRARAPRGFRRAVRDLRCLHPAAAFACAAALLGAPSIANAQAEPTDGQTVLRARCGSCHSQLNSGALSRIGEMRKSPEGWDMSIQRMQVWHGVAISDAERAALVRHLANQQGLAPAEAAPYRYALERRPNYVEPEHDADFVALCGRCHTVARSGLQRRDAEEWERLAHTHAGQWATIEFQDKARNRYWWKEVSEELPAKLGARFPLESAEWSAWRRRARISPAGEWSVSGYRPGRGAYAGTLRVVGNGRDHYDTQIAIEYEDGSRVTGSGKAVLYTGYEWRGNASWGDEGVHQVFALSEDGETLSGRWFLADQDAIGGDFRAERAHSGTPRIAAVLPSALRAGERRTVIVHGVDLPLEGAVSLGAGITVTEVLSRDADRVAVVAEVDDDLELGGRDVAVGPVVHKGAFVVYRDVEALRVEPSLAIARVGGGPIAPVPAQFDAFGYLRGPDGKAGTADDVALGRVPVKWRVEPFDQIAEEMDDTAFAGEIDASGRFHPAQAGPNPERRYSTNNTGRLRVVAQTGDGDAAVSDSGELVVTVQRWIDPAIR